MHVAMADCKFKPTKNGVCSNLYKMRMLGIQVGGRWEIKAS